MPAGRARLAADLPTQGECRPPDRLPQLGTRQVQVSFASQDRAYRLVSYRLEPLARRLDAPMTEELRRLAIRQIRQHLLRNPPHDGKAGDLMWDVANDRFEIVYCARRGRDANLRTRHRMGELADVGATRGCRGR